MIPFKREDIFLLSYIREPEGILIGLAEQPGAKTTADVLQNSNSGNNFKQ